MGAESSDKEMTYEMPDMNIITIGSEHFRCAEDLCQTSFISKAASRTTFQPISDAQKTYFKPVSSAKQPAVSIIQHSNPIQSVTKELTAPVSIHHEDQSDCIPAN